VEAHASDTWVTFLVCAIQSKIVVMRLRVWQILLIQAALVIGLLLGLRSGLMPLGIAGEWEWMRLPAWATPAWEWLLLAAVAVLAYSAFAAWGLQVLGAGAARRAEPVWLAGLIVMAIAIQVSVPTAAPPGYDLTKWAAVNYLPSSTGYFKVAREQAAADPWKFLSEYPRWIRSQDSLHIGTHPPGLIATQCLLLETMKANPGLVKVLLDRMPSAVADGFRVFGAADPRPLLPAERAALYATALLTLLACAGTVLPLYLLVRSVLPAPAAWVAAALWPLAPAANLFQPVADTAYPFLSTSALALTAWALRLHGGSGRPRLGALLLAVAAGAVLALGMFFTMAFLPVGFMVGLTIVLAFAISWRTRGVVILATGVGFLAVVLCGCAATGANPLVIGMWNLHHHARFYAEYPRTYHLWLLANPIELAVAMGLPSAVWCLLGLFGPRKVPLSFWAALLVVALVDLTGRNMGEVARLWMFFMPPLLVAAGSAHERLERGGGAWALGASIALVGLQTLGLQTMIQVVYPV
jgi:methylthioxylose transferase